MTAMEMLSNALKIEQSSLTKQEVKILEANLLFHVCKELREYFREINKNFFYLMKLTLEKEDNMLDENLTRCIINDILSTKEYSISGIAYYTQTPEEVIYELVIGKNLSPSITLFRKIIELHRSVRKDLYKIIMEKILTR